MNAFDQMTELSRLPKLNYRRLVTVLKDITQENPSTENIDLSPILYSDKKSTAPHYCNTSSKRREP